MKKLNLDVFFQAGLLIFLALLIWKSASYPFESRLYPQIIGGATIILLAVSIVRHFRTHTAEENAAPELVLRRKRFFKASIIVLLSTAVGFMGGFLLSVLCYYIGYALLQENKSRLFRTLGIGIALTVLFYISFGWLMHVPLLRGWLIRF
jgi:hypothetical protein